MSSGGKTPGEGGTPIPSQASVNPCDTSPGLFATVENSMAALFGENSNEDFDPNAVFMDGLRALGEIYELAQYAYRGAPIRGNYMCLVCREWSRENEYRHASYCLGLKLHAHHASLEVLE